MKKLVLAMVATLTLLSVAGCVAVGKAPVGKGPVVTKG
jgi:predicted small lipoprotein YifL